MLRKQLLVLFMFYTLLVNPAVNAQDAPHTPVLSGTVATQQTNAASPVPNTSQNIRDPRSGEPGSCAPESAGRVGVAGIAANAAGGARFGSSPFTPPKADDSNFVVDQDGGLDTGCTFRGGGPLVFTIKTTRVVGDVQKLKASNLISPFATLQMPAYDVDFFGGGGTYNPERDRVTFNGRVVPTEFLRGDDGVWRLNEFSVPIEWVNFPADPGENGSVTPADNTVRIDIDTANGEEVWCTSIDWAALTIKAPRPIVMAHGILSDGGAWAKASFSWVGRLNSLGILNSNSLNMGRLDSIGNNAGKIGREVTRRRRQWGVDKVNLVCHSKGGLDSRHYVENSNSVERVIQLGTPNAGSPLADVVQGIAVGSLGILPTVIINGLAGPAGVQLTTPYMRGYNLFHGSNPRVKYLAAAGDYNPDCFILNPFCRPVERALQLITGRGDTIVPVSSVHALGFTEKRTFRTSGINKQSLHTEMNGSGGMYSTVRDRVETFGARSLTVEEAAPAVGQTTSVIGSIRQGEVQRRTLTIDQATPTYFTLMYPSGDLDLALISPSGRRFDRTTVVGDPNVGRDEQEVLGGMMEVFSFSAPEVGVWNIETSAPSVTEASGAVSYAVTGWIEQPAITFAASVADASIHAGERLRLLGTLKNNSAPITDAVVSATVALPDDTTRAVTLHDDGRDGDATAGDGTYTGDFAETTQAGNYRIAFAANRVVAAAGAPAFSRAGFVLATVSRSTSTIVPGFRDEGIDTDGDGLFNKLVIHATVNATAAADYRVLGTLTDRDGNTLSTSVGAALAVGDNAVRLEFDGEAIYNNRVDGPYTLAVVRLAEESDLAIIPLDERTDAHRTAGYDFRSFQHAPINLTGGGSAEGMDFDGDNRFDNLAVGVGVEVASSGYYQWSARLTDIDGTEIGFASGGAYFGAGENTIGLDFAGEPIGQNGVDGPYYVRGLLLYGAGDSLVASDAFTIEGFRANQFEGYVACDPPVISGASVDNPVLSPPNHRMVDVTVSYNVTSSCAATSTLTVTSNEPQNGTGDGDTDSDWEVVDANRVRLRAERAGSGTGRIYTITITATDSAGNTSRQNVTVSVPHDRGR